MSTKLPTVSAIVFEKVLFQLGFQKVHQSGSHAFYRHPDGRYTTLPHHGNQDLSRFLIRAILRQIEISPEVFINLLSKV